MNCEQNSQTGQKLAQAGNFFRQLQGVQFLLQGLLCTESHSHLLICDSLRTQVLYGTLTNSKETNEISSLSVQSTKGFYLHFF